MEATKITMSKGDLEKALEHYLNAEVLKKKVGVTDISYDEKTGEMAIEVCDFELVKAAEATDGKAPVKGK